MKATIGFFCLFLSLFSSFLQAQPAGFTAVKDEKTFRERFTAAGKSISTIKSDFVQEKSLSMLEEKIVSKGQFFYKKDKKVRLEYTTPYSYLMIINGDNVVIRDENKTNRFSAKSNKMFRQINQIMVDCMSGAALSNPDYSVKAYESGTQYALALTPTSKVLKEFFKNIWIYVDKKNYTVQKVEMNEVSGDVTVMKFSHTVLNQTLSDATFELKN